MLEGQPGAYKSTAEGAEVNVPATVQAVIAARIDRLKANAKRALNAAAVVGMRITPELITALGIPPVVDELVGCPTHRSSQQSGAACRGAPWWAKIRLWSPVVVALSTAR